MFKKVALALAFSLSVVTGAKAQFNVGGAIAINQYAKELGTFFAFQARVGFDYLERKHGMSIGFNYSPNTSVTMRSRTATNSTRTKSEEVPLKETVQIQNYYFHNHYRFGAEDKDFRFGVITGLSVDKITVTYKQEKPRVGYRFYDNNYKYTDFKTSGPKIDLGLTADYRVGRGLLTAEVVLAIPATPPAIKFIDTAMPLHYGLWLGYKFVFGQRRNNYF